MKEAYGDMLEMDCDALVVTINGFTKANGEAVMGRGIAKQIADLMPEVPKSLGRMLQLFGNNVAVIATKPMPIISFPVKPDYVKNNGANVVSHCKTSVGEWTPGFLAKADIQLIEQSLYQLVELANNKPEWKTILIPRVGCGAGELNYEDIKPLMEKYLDDRFICCTFK